MKNTEKSKFNPKQNLNLTPIQVLIFEISMLSAGALLAIYLPEFFISAEKHLRILLIISGIYICYIHFKQANK